MTEETTIIVNYTHLMMKTNGSFETGKYSHIKFHN